MLALEIIPPAIPNAIDFFTEQNGITFSVTPEGPKLANTYDLDANTIIVIDDKGIARYKYDIGTVFNVLKIDEVLENAFSLVQELVNNLKVLDQPSRYTISGRLYLKKNYLFTISGRRINEFKRVGQQYIIRNNPSRSGKVCVINK